MRWILVFMLLYLIPLTVLFKNYKSFKRACVYGSIYVMLSTTIVITNIYLSGLKIIEETLDYDSLQRKAIRSAPVDTSEAICMSVAEIASKFNVAAIIAFTSFYL